MRLISRDYVCEYCGFHEILMVSTDVDHWANKDCPQCSRLGTFEFRPHINVSTEKLSETLPDCVGSKRFTEQKEQRKLQKMAKEARNRGNLTEAKEIKQSAASRGLHVKS
ncbi:hypothetical protein OAF54_00115 [bacterium]|nr:hypothetical protein [bacterium]